MGWTYVKKTGEFVTEASEMGAFVAQEKRMPRCPKCGKEMSISLFCKAEEWEVIRRKHDCGARLCVFND